MKHLLIILILTVAGSCFAINSDPNELPYFEYDPNSIVVDADTVTVTMTIRIPKNQARALNYLNIDIIDIFQRSTFKRLLQRYIQDAKAKLVAKYTVDELKAKTEE